MRVHLMQQHIKWHKHTSGCTIKCVPKHAERNRSKSTQKSLIRNDGEITREHIEICEQTWRVDSAASNRDSSATCKANAGGQTVELSVYPLRRITSHRLNILIKYNDVDSTERRTTTATSTVAALKSPRTH